MENIYLNKDSVESFSKNIKYDRNSLIQVGRITYEYFRQIEKNSLSILDIGIGSGDFTLPLIDGLLSAGLLDFYLDCFDISLYMLQHLEENLNKRPDLRKKVKYFKYDAERGLLSIFKPNSYDLIIITFVLHYIKNWEKLLEDVHECCKQNGLFIQSEIIGDLRNVDGKFDADSPEIFREFWEAYFLFRQEFYPWAPDICVSDISRVIDYLTKKQWFHVYKVCEFNNWKFNLKWGDLCQWIISAPVSSLGVGLTQKQRYELSSKMQNWLKQRKIDLNLDIEITWGIRVIWMKK